MNTYKKYMPNVFLAQCEEQHEKGEEIILTTRYGKENPSIVHNLIFERDGFYYYSITRADGFNARERAARKAERLKGYAATASRKGDEYYKRSNKDADFLSLGEPIKVGHHSERRHRKIIEQAQNNTQKWVDEMNKADSYEQRAAYWEKKAENDINLSMPESIEYFKFKLEKVEKIHAGMKDGTIPRAHSYSLTYAKKEVNEAKKKYETALKLWA